MERPPLPSPARLATGRAAVRAQVRFFRENLGRVDSTWKGDGTRVTAADHAISERILAQVADEWPADDVLSEELAGGQRALNAEYAWVLDPVDGTNNYALGLPLCGISLGLLRAGQPVHGWIYDATRDELLEGGVGTPVPRAAVARTGPIDTQSLLALHTPLLPTRLGDAARLFASFKVRALGSSALHLAYVATGRLDAVLDFNVKVWDIAAGVALARSVGLDVRWLGPEPFPLQRFDTTMAPLAYCAGRPEACDAVQVALGRA